MKKEKRKVTDGRQKEEKDETKHGEERQDEDESKVEAREKHGPAASPLRAHAKPTPSPVSGAIGCQ